MRTCFCEEPLQKTCAFETKLFTVVECHTLEELRDAAWEFARELGIAA
ncbi:MAG: hypothetical protein ACP5KV_07765 [Candidatus Methanomethylicaceae archaeon]